MNLFPRAWTRRFAYACAWLCFAPLARAEVWYVASPDHGQTFAYGSEQHRVWKQRNGHLAVALNLTNDPYVDSVNPRRCDEFLFGFPGVSVGKDGRTFFYRAPDGRQIPVAVKSPDFLGINEVKLLPTTTLIINRPHGYLSLVLAVSATSRRESL